MLRRLHPEQPDSFAFTSANAEWAQRQIAKYPEGRQASAVIPLLWRAQEQEGWVSKPAIEAIAGMLELAPIRVLEVASFYFMFQLQPVGDVANVQICGTTSCMICGAEDLIAVCREKIAPNPHERSADGKLSWEEVECLGACSNAPMAQIGKDYYEDLTAERLAEILDALVRGEVPTPGPQNGRFASEPLGGLTSLAEGAVDHGANASVALAEALGDTVKRITGEEPEPTVALLREGDEALRARREAESPEGPAETEGEPTSAEEPGPKAAEPEFDPSEKAAREAAPTYSAESESERAVETDPETAAEEETVETPAEQETVEGEAPSASERVRDAARAAGEAARAMGEPVAAPTKAGGEESAASQPHRLDEPREGGPDDLKKIKGIGPALEKTLHDMGYYHFDQIAAWSPDEVSWVDENLEGFRGRVSRDEWVEQAKVLAAGGSTEFSDRVDDGDVY